uniref:Large ribosomal subunit protein mL45 n=1 Tax=Oncorhynchus mykiss TaxID=8022 RepID=A0A8K9Y4C6_ONCMY
MQNAEASLEVRYPLPFVVPIRTKKRYFVPPAVGVKGKAAASADQEAKARAAGVVLRQEYMERDINIACTAGVFDPYIPPEGDARLSSVTNTKPSLHCRIRKLKEHDAEFTTKVFPVKAQEIFMHSLSYDPNQLSLSVHPVQEMVRGNRYKTLRWHFVESLEVTVRMHSRQSLAVYDRFGRLMMGSEEEPRDVLEYLVLERHLVNHYGMWRLHGKIVPAWAPVTEPIVKTVMILGPELKPGEEFEGLNYEVPKPKAVQWHK